MTTSPRARRRGMLAPMSTFAIKLVDYFAPLPIRPPHPPYIHAPDVTGEAALCAAQTTPDHIIASGPVEAVDCPACQERLCTDEGMQAAQDGARRAQGRLWEQFRARIAEEAEGGPC